MKTILLILAIVIGTAFAADGYKIKQEFSAPKTGTLVRCVDAMNERDQKRLIELLEHVQTWAAEFAKKEGIKLATEKMPERIVFIDAPLAWEGLLTAEPVAGRSEPKRDRIVINFNDNTETLLHEFGHWFFGEAASDQHERTHALCDDFRDYCWPKWREIKKAIK